MHLPVGYAIYSVNKRLNLPGLLVGSMVPDLEVPIFLLIYGSDVWPRDRLVLHSLLGAATLGTLIAIGVTLLIYPVFVRTFFPSGKDRVEAVCRFSGSLAVSCFLGNVFHVLLDLPTHVFNPLFWPFHTFTSNFLIAILGSEVIFFLMHGSLSLILILLLYDHRGHLTELVLGEHAYHDRLTVP